MAITIKELGQIINTSLPKTNFIIQGEVRQPKKYNSGHTYFELKDNDSMIKGILWKNSSTTILIEGDMVEAQGKIEYYNNKGNINFIINKIKKVDSNGKMLEYMVQMSKYYQDNGYYENKLDLPKLIKRILILTSSNGAAIHDFNYVIESSNIFIEQTIVDVPVQGADSPIKIANVLDTHELSNYDLIIITRGGGSMEDLWGFNHKKIIESVHNCKIPILSAIGHATDVTLLDYVADVSRPTPSLAAQFIVDYNLSYLDKIKNKTHTIIKQFVNNRINILTNILSSVNIKHNKNKERILENLRIKIISSIQNRLNQYSNILTKYNTRQPLIEGYNNISIYKEMPCNNKLNIVEFNKLNFEEFNKTIQTDESFILEWNNVKILITNYELIYQ